MNEKKGFSKRAFILALIILTVVNVTALLIIGLPVLQQLTIKSTISSQVISTGEIQKTSTSIIRIVTSTSPPGISVNTPIEPLKNQGIIVLSLRDGNNNHLFAYNPQYMPLTRLTNSNWDDNSPSISNDGSKIAFSSNKTGFWDIYVLDLKSNSISQITNSPEYDGAPSWSPDDQWLAYESYVENNFEIFIKTVFDLSQPAINLTTDPASDFTPAWSPQGREIAFVSNRSGSLEIWIAKLDQAEDRNFNISKNPNRQASHPTWSPSGDYLAWASQGEDISSILIWSRKFPTTPPFSAGNGNWPIWGSEENYLLTKIEDPNKTLISVYNLSDGSIIYPIIELPGCMYGASWRTKNIVDMIIKISFPPEQRDTEAPLWTPFLTLTPQPPDNRKGIVQLIDVTAPYPYLNDAVNEAFEGMRKELSKEIGWDYLASLENAYTPLTEPPSPSMEENWLFTGRAVAINALPINAGWMAIVKENIGGQVFWRLYLKSRYQDGSQGIPMRERSWNFNARFNGDPSAFENGGQLDNIPAGYWVDFTELASRYGWHRLPALSNWRSYYPGTRFNILVNGDNLDWNTAMAEIYPPEALITATYRPTFNPTNTFTPESIQILSRTVIVNTPISTVRPTSTLPAK